MIFCDGHVHIHDCFDINNFFYSAWTNFALVSHKLGFGKSFTGILFLTESNNINWFLRFYDIANGKDSHGELSKNFEFQLTNEENSLIVKFKDNKELILIAGRQIVSKEKLEVLALPIREHFGEGESIEKIISEVKDQDGIPVIPWGVGKWFGKRGMVVSQFLNEKFSDKLYLGDNSGRPIFWQNPSHFKKASKLNIPILPGSDPLPFPSELQKVGRFGFFIRDTIDQRNPATGIKKLLLNSKTSIQRYGELENPLRFIKNQFLVQLNKFN